MCISNSALSEKLKYIYKIKVSAKLKSLQVEIHSYSYTRPITKLHFKLFFLNPLAINILSNLLNQFKIESQKDFNYIFEYI